MKTGDLLGVHSIGPGATELIHIAQPVPASHGTVDYFVHNVFNYHHYHQPGGVRPYRRV